MYVYQKDGIDTCGDGCERLNNKRVQKIYYGFNDHFIVSYFAFKIKLIRTIDTYLLQQTICGLP